MSAPIGGVHPERRAAIRRHARPDHGHPISWQLPMLDPAVHNGGIDLDLLGMRLAADINEERPSGRSRTCVVIVSVT